MRSGRFVAVLVAAIVFGVVGTAAADHELLPPSGPGDTPTLGTDDPPPPTGFSDVSPQSVHARAIYEIAALGWATGYSDGTFRPGEAVQRGQMATFLSRALDLGAGGSPSPFNDTSGTVHEQAIVAVSNAGIAQGYSDGTFRPAMQVTRGQMAAFLARAFDLPPAAPSFAFSDIAGSTHEAAIEALVAAGITGGFADGTFRPSAPVTRGQMATFLVRATSAG